jgi:hypothetical protein
MTSIEAIRYKRKNLFKKQIFLIDLIMISLKMDYINGLKMRNVI